MAAGATWGISGPVFLWLFHAAGVLAVGVALLWRWWRTRALRRPHTEGLTAEHLAALRADRAGVISTGLAALRARGAVEAAAGVVTRSAAFGGGEALPAEATPLERALFEAVRTPRQASGLHRDTTVRPALEAIEADLRRRGLHADRGLDLRLSIVAGVPLGALLVLGAVRAVAGLINDRPIGLLIFSMIVYGSAMLLVVNLEAPRVRDTFGVWSGARREHQHLAPHLCPSWATYGPAGAAMSVALHGDTAIRAGDPAYAAGLQEPPGPSTDRRPSSRALRRGGGHAGASAPLGTGSSSSYTCGSAYGDGSSCGGGSSSGGGSSCGG
ncbi:TIGR04222 domain-containing membrane protein [Dactylosporangium sp. NPDC005555]|uniref:TIGR04222 domain-containing membrane protein n=1 Tax=Dactylosporangium sp. NPDC005555 TaxID=3154889 RepID=UPI0033A0F38A